LSSHKADEPTTKEYIKLEKAELVNDKTLLFKLSCSKTIGDCFLSDKMYIQYDRSIRGLDDSVLCIPAVSGLITIAWAHGADLYVEELDKTYLESLRKIQPVMTKLYPDFPSSKIHARKVVSNRFCNDKYGLLFSGGLDSITSYIKYRSKKPELIYVWGIDVRSYDTESWKKTLKMLAIFSAREGVRINVIRTNIYEMMDRDFLLRKFGLDWWPNVSYGIVLTGLCAPLTCVAGVDSLLFASGATSTIGFRYPSGSYPLIINNLSWGDTQVFLDNRELGRQLKIRYFLKNFTENYFHPFLKVCNKHEEPASNCGVCEKCYRSIVGLVVEGIDPVKCGFNNVDRETFKKIKKRFYSSNLLTRKFFVESRGEFYNRMEGFSFWEDIHQHIPEKINHNVCGSKEFLEWFRSFNLSRYLQHANNTVVISPSHILYNCATYFTDHMPKNMRIVANQLLSSLSHHYEKIRWK